MANDMANDVAAPTDPTPLFDRVIGEMGNPVPAVAIDRSYEAIVAIAEATRSGARPVAAAEVTAHEGAHAAVSLPSPTQSADAPAGVKG